jgi:hypothetical protein
LHPVLDFAPLALDFFTAGLSISIFSPERLFTPRALVGSNEVGDAPVPSHENGDVRSENWKEKVTFGDACFR